MGALRPLHPGILSSPVFLFRAIHRGMSLCVFLQEAEQELLTRVQPMLASVGQGYNTVLLLQGQKTEAPSFVPQVRSHQHTGILMFKYCLGNLCLLTRASLGTA